MENLVVGDLVSVISHLLFFTTRNISRACIFSLLRFFEKSVKLQKPGLPPQGFHFLKVFFMLKPKIFLSLSDFGLRISADPQNRISDFGFGPRP